MTQTNCDFRFYALDGIRGVAAIAVMIGHLTGQNGIRILGGAEAAVDLFFVLSGFVLMHSYAGPIKAGMSFYRFVQARVFRLGPMYMFGFALGAFGECLQYGLLDVSSPSLKELAIAASLNFFVLPYLNSVSWAFGNTLINGPTFPFNSPSWSLFFELFVNILFFFSLNIMRHSRNIIRPIAAIFFAIFLLLTIHYRDFNPGWGTQNFLLGFPRVIAEFFFGAVLYDFHRHISVTNLGPKLIVVALSIFCFLMPTNKTRFVMIFILAPALIFLASNLDLPKWANLACTQLGAISYPLYITHYAFFKIAFQLSYFSGLEPAVQSLVGSASALLFATVCAGFDSRARKYLRNS